MTFKVTWSSPHRTKEEYTSPPSMGKATFLESVVRDVFYKRCQAINATEHYARVWKRTATTGFIPVLLPFSEHVCVANNEYSIAFSTTTDKDALLLRPIANTSRSPPNTTQFVVNTSATNPHTADQNSCVIKCTGHNINNVPFDLAAETMFKINRRYGVLKRIRDFHNNVVDSQRSGAHLIATARILNNCGQYVPLNISDFGTPNLEPGKTYHFEYIEHSTLPERSSYTTVLHRARIPTREVHVTIVTRSSTEEHSLTLQLHMNVNVLRLAHACKDNLMEKLKSHGNSFDVSVKQTYPTMTNLMLMDPTPEGSYAVVFAPTGTGTNMQYKFNISFDLPTPRFIPKATSNRENFVKHESAQKTFPNPANRHTLNLPCPKEECGGSRKRVWICFVCKSTMLFDLNAHVYCNCGRLETNKLSFECSDHTDFVPYPRLNQLLRSMYKN